MDERAAALLVEFRRIEFLKGEFLLKLKFLRERNDSDWVVEDKFDPVRAERKKEQGNIEVSRDTKSGQLTAIDLMYYQNFYPVTAIAYGLYPIRDPDPANLAPLRDGDLNCVARRAVEHFEGAMRGQGLTPIRRQRIQEWEERVHETGATVDDVAELEKVLKRAIILRDIAGENIYTAAKTSLVATESEVKLSLSATMATPGPKTSTSKSREVRIYEGDVWQAIREATQGEPLAVWLLGGQDRSLIVDQFVLQDGHTFRTREAHERLQVVKLWVIPQLPRKLLERTTQPASWPKKRTVGSQPLPAFFQTSRRLA